MCWHSTFDATLDTQKKTQNCIDNAKTSLAAILNINQTTPPLHTQQGAGLGDATSAVCSLLDTFAARAVVDAAAAVSAAFAAAVPRRMRALVGAARVPPLDAAVDAALLAGHAQENAVQGNTTVWWADCAAVELQQMTAQHHTAARGAGMLDPAHAAAVSFDASQLFRQVECTVAHALYGTAGLVATASHIANR